MRVTREAMAVRRGRERGGAGGRTGESGMTARYGTARHGAVWRGTVRRGVMRCGVAWHRETAEGNGVMKEARGGGREVVGCFGMGWVGRSEGAEVDERVEEYRRRHPLTISLVVIVRASTTCLRKKGLSTVPRRAKEMIRRGVRGSTRNLLHTFDVFPLSFSILLREIVSRQFVRNKKLESHRWCEKREEQLIDIKIEWDETERERESEKREKNI